MSRSLLRYDDLEEPQQARWQFQPGHSNAFNEAAHKRKRKSDGTRNFKKQRPQHGVWNPEASTASFNPLPPVTSVADAMVQVVPGDAEPAEEGTEEVEEEEEEWAEKDEEHEQGEAYEEEEEEQDINRVLTHAEIWDDRALIGAWEAAEAEYEAFRTRRADVLAAKRNVHPLPQLDNSAPGVALWYEAPPPGSKQALSAFEMGRAYAAEKKVAGAATALAEQRLLALPPTLPSLLPTPADETRAIGAVPAAAAPKKKARTLKGTIPPSSKTQGSAAWHAACATISCTPNRIAGQELPPPPPALTSPAATPAPAPPTAPVDADVLQNLCMSWYYAGYYQAQLSAQQQQQQPPSQ